MKSYKLLVALVSLILSATPAFAQSDRGTITGTVTDPSGAVVAGAKVTTTDLETGDVRETTTGGEGSFTIPELKANPYKVTVEAQGFKTSSLENVIVAVQTTRTVDITLEIGEISNVVTVTDDGSALLADSPIRQTNVTEQQVRELPLQVAAESGGRTPLAFIFLDSNVTTQSGNTSNRGTNAAQFRVSGGQGEGTEILIDGGTTRRAQNGTFFTETGPGPNAVQEFTVSTSSFSSEFGSTSGGVVNFTVKSGGNEYHGELYEFHQNDALGANSFLNNATGIDKPRVHQNDFGFNIGGPIRIPTLGEGTKRWLYDGKDRTFFFFNYGGYRFTESETVDISVPTLRMRQGDFGELLTDPYILNLRRPNGDLVFPGGVRIFDPRSGGPNNRTEFENNFIPVSARDPVGVALLNFFPLPNRPGVYHNYRVTSFRPTNMNNFVTKIDHVLTQSQRLAFSYSYRQLDTIQGGFPRFEAPFYAEGRWDQNFTSHYVRLQHDYTITPTLLNHLNLGFNRVNAINLNPSVNNFDPRSLGLPANATQNLAFPVINFPGYGFPESSTDPRAYQGIGSTFFTDAPLADNSVHLSDTVTWIKGRHTLKFGVDLRWQQLNVTQLLASGGQFNFRHNQTTNNCCPDNQGWPIASMMTGATEFSFNSNRSVDPGWRYFYPAFFVNDDIKLTRNLTINVGLRYEIPYPRTEAHDAFRSFDPTITNPVVGVPGAIASSTGLYGPQAEHEGFAAPDYSNIGPRLGFAYSINDKTVVRGGYGIYYAPILYGAGGNSDLSEGLAGFNTYIAHISGGNDTNQFLSTFPARPDNNPQNQFINGDVIYFNKDYKTGRTQQWSFDVQRELPANFVISVGYIGHRGTRLRSNLNRLNAVPFNALKLGFALLDKFIPDLTPADRAFASSVGVTLPATNADVYPGFGGRLNQALKPFPQYNRITSQLESNGKSAYHALQAKLNRRFAQGVQFGASYTFSKLVTNAAESLRGGDTRSGILQNPYDTSGLYQESPDHPRHVLVFNYLWELPFGRGRRFLNQGGIVDKIFGGWQVGGIHRYQSGLPIVARLEGPRRDWLDFVGINGNLRPNLTGDPVLTNDPQVGTDFQLVNPDAFALPPPFAPFFGGVPPLSLDGGATVNPAYIEYYSNPLRFFGDAPSVLTDARVLPYFSEDFSILKKTRLAETLTLEFRGEIFNVFNRHRYVGPELNFDNPIFGNSGVENNRNVYGPRTVQLGVRLIF
jgi:Carboxypeptidase regulatory-like domain